MKVKELTGLRPLHVKLEMSVVCMRYATRSEFASIRALAGLALALSLVACGSKNMENSLQSVSEEAVEVTIQRCYAYAASSEYRTNYDFSAQVLVVNRTDVPIVLTDAFQATYLSVEINGTPEVALRMDVSLPLEIRTGGFRDTDAPVGADEFFVLKSGQSVSFPVSATGYHSNWGDLGTLESTKVRVHFDPVNEKSATSIREFLYPLAEGADFFPQSRFVSEPYEVRLNIKDRKIYPLGD